ncbi:MAG: WG repeat-containing protein [Clostridia bacterium]|nr:WG repeat-containing protein [Clostridia bacterium]
MRSIRIRILAVITLLLICAIWYIYLIGWFDVAFFARSDENEFTESSDETEITDVTDTETDVGASSDAVVSSDVGASSDAVTTDGSTDDTAAGDEGEQSVTVSFGGADEYSALGYEISTDDWDERFVLADAGEIFTSLPSQYSFGTVTKSVVRYQFLTDAGLREAVYYNSTSAEPAVTLYMGYVIIAHYGSSARTVYTTSGEYVGYYDSDSISPAYQRDTSGRALFTYKDAYYYLDADSGEFIESDYVPDTDDRGVHFDYLPSYGSASEGRYFSSSLITTYTYEDIEGEYDEDGNLLAYQIPTVTRMFALSSSTGLLTDYIYYGAYNFSESLAAVVNEDGWLYYITRSGGRGISVSTTYRDVSLERRVLQYYMPALTDGEESIGFYYFEYGLVRARRIRVDNYYYTLEENPQTYVYEDADVLIYSDGSEFPVPSGYEVKAYSCGMILLQNTETMLYGYMDYTGSWIVQPSLSYAKPFYEGLAVVGSGNSRGLIDKSGNFVIPYGSYTQISNVSSGVLAVFGSDGWNILYKMEAPAGE